MTEEEVDWHNLSREELDFLLSPSKSAKDAMAVLGRHVQQTDDARQSDELNVRSDVAYGPAERQKYDVYAPSGPGPHPCLVFIHGGFWQEGSKDGSGFAARALAGEGWALAAIGYTLTPDVRLREIVSEIAAALQHLHASAAELGIDPGRIILTGHSAGGHLTAAILAGLGGEQAARIPAGAVPVSGVYDLRPIAASYVNDLAGIDADEIRELSPLFMRPVRDIPVHILIGGDETEAFQSQSRALAATWFAHLSHLTTETVPGRDHFDILDRLAETESTTFQTIRAMV